MEAVAQQLLQPVGQFLIIGRCIQRDIDLTQKSRVIDSLMGLAVPGNKACAVDRKHHIFLQQIDIVNDLIIGALQKGGINADYRQHSLTCKACCKGDSVLLCHSDIKKACWMAVCKKLKTGAIFHRCCNGTEILIFLPFCHECFAKYS